MNEFTNLGLFLKQKYIRRIIWILLNLFVTIGQCAVFDNHRVLHGRSGFEMHPESGTRTYHGGYIDWDELISKLNVLRVKLGMS